jgi:hypothetical protein
MADQAGEAPKPSALRIVPAGVNFEEDKIYFDIFYNDRRIAFMWIFKTEEKGETIIRARITLADEKLRDSKALSKKPLICKVNVRDGEDLGGKVKECFGKMAKAFEEVVGKALYVRSSGEVGSTADAIIDTIIMTARNWDRYRDGFKEMMRERAKQAGGRRLEEDLGSEILFEDEVGGKKIKILASDGTHINAYGDFIDLGDYLVISESTFANMEISTEDMVFERIDPVGIAVIYKRDQGSILSIVDKKLYYPRYHSNIVIGDRIIRLRGDLRGVKADLIYSFPDITTLKKVLDGEEIKRTWADVGNEIIAKLRDYIVLDDERIYDVIASYIIMTYFYDVFTAVPYFYIHGPPGSGKTRTNLTITYMCRRGIFVADPSIAALYRMIDALKLTTGLDESILNEKAKRIIAAGYKKGAAVPRAEPAKEGIVLRFFDATAPRIFSFEHPPREDYLLQRCILINILKARPKSFLDPQPSEFKEIREVLYYMRLSRLSEILDAREKALKMLEDQRVWGRDAELWAPILAGSILIGREKTVMDYILEDVGRRRANEMMYDEEKIVLRAIDELFNKTPSLAAEGEKVITFMSKDLQKIIKNQMLEDEDCLEIEPDGFIKGVKNEPRCRDLEKEIEKKWKTQKIGIVLRNLGFEKYKKKKGKGSGARYVYEIKHSGFINIAKKYDYEPESGEAEKKDEAGKN